MTAMNLLIEIGDGVATLTLNRPEVHNAFDEHLIAELTAAFTEAGAHDAVRAIVLRANGPSFCAGGDLGWMRRMANYSAAENLQDARALAELMRTVDTCPKPTLARVQGNAFAGGLGLLACCDIVVASAAAQFAVTEVRLGLIPAVISPYVVRAMGARQARRFCLTAERFSALQAEFLGVVHEVVAPEDLDQAIARHLHALKAAGPDSLHATKQLIAAVDQPLSAEIIEDTAARIARIRATSEAREGIAAFFDKRKPAWQTPNETAKP
jgi:methylglutaconyl-CoA hydratase